MKNHAIRIPAGALALLLTAAAPLAAHGEHPEAAGGAVHLLLHLLGSPWALAAGAAVAAVAVLVHGARAASRSVPGARRS